MKQPSSATSSPKHMKQRITEILLFTLFVALVAVAVWYILPLSIQLQVPFGSKLASLSYRDRLETLKNLSTILISVIGGGFVVYKLFAGWLAINLTISVELERTAQDAESDILVIKIQLDKGDIDAAHLEKLEVKINDLSSAARSIIPAHIFEPSYLRRSDGKPLCLSPRERIHFSTYAIVPRQSVVEVSARVFADRLFYDFPLKYIPWRRRKYVESFSSGVSAPKWAKTVENVNPTSIRPSVDELANDRGSVVPV